MARNLKPKWKQSRREGYSLFGNDKWQKKQAAGGSYAPKRKSSDYVVQFREKQKVKRIYGMLEKQFARFFSIASKSRGNTGIKFLQLLEMRLDNVVYKLGLAPTRASARQLITHGHILVNGKKLDIPSYIVSSGDIISMKETSQQKDFAKVRLEENKEVHTPKWLKKSKFGGEVVSEPPRDMIDPGINERLIVEFYSK